MMIIIQCLVLLLRFAQPDLSDRHILSAQEYQSRGDLFGAERELQALLKEARAAGSHSLEVARALALQGVFYQDVGRFPEAEWSFTRSLKILREINGQEDKSQVPLISHLAWLYVETGRTAEARRLHLESWIARLEPGSKYIPALMESLGGLYALQGSFTSAQQMFRRDFDLLAQRGSSISIDMASALNNFGFIQLKAGRYDDALNSFSSSLQVWTQLPYRDDLQPAISRVGLAEAYAGLGRYDHSSQFFQGALPIFEQRCGPKSVRTADVLNNYAEVLRHQGRKTEARDIQMRARHILDESMKSSGSPGSIDIRDLD
jgi:tetratricopeptide (TPR) repeat protein